MREFNLVFEVCGISFSCSKFFKSFDDWFRAISALITRQQAGWKFSPRLAHEAHKQSEPKLHKSGLRLLFSLLWLYSAFNRHGIRAFCEAIFLSLSEFKTHAMPIIKRNCWWNCATLGFVLLLIIIVESSPYAGHNESGISINMNGRI